MTSAPPGLLATRTLLLNNLDGLSGAEVGITGDAAHKGGYHCGKDRLVTNDYSNRHARDRAGLSDYASALDVGQFSHRVGGKTHDLRAFSAWLVAQCKANAGDTRDIREVIYSTDGKTVKRWDRLGSSGTGDDSHLWHTHISVFRDATKAGRGLVPLMTRYLTEIGQLAAPREDDEMFTDAEKAELLRLVRATNARMLMVAGNDDDVTTTWAANPAAKEANELKLALTAIANRDFTDEPAIVAGVLAGLNPAAIAAAVAAALPTDQADQVIDELRARLAA